MVTDCSQLDGRALVIRLPFQGLVAFLLAAGAVGAGAGALAVFAKAAFPFGRQADDGKQGQEAQKAQAQVAQFFKECGQIALLPRGFALMRIIPPRG